MSTAPAPPPDPSDRPGPTGPVATPGPAGAPQPGARPALRRSAERLFAAHGVDGVSLRQVTREAQQRNSTAVTYHFGSRDGLLMAVLEHHLDQVALRRDTLLLRYREAGQGDLGELADGLVMPLAAELDCPDGGPEFLQIAAEVINRSDWTVEQGGPIAALIGSAGGWAELAQGWLSADAAGLHRRFAVMRFVYVEMGRRARQPPPRRDDRLFASQLSDLVAALLTAPVSPRTQSLLHARTR